MRLVRVRVRTMVGFGLGLGLVRVMVVRLGFALEEVRHGHVTAYVHVELYGFSMELAVQKSFVQFWPKPSVNIEETDIVGTRL